LHRILILISIFAFSACIPSGRENGWPNYDPPKDGEVPKLETDSAALNIPKSPWRARPVTPNAVTVDDGVYIVQPGDTLRGIANKTGAGSQVIAQDNGLVDPYIIRPGQKLTIKGGRYHNINAGETGIAIARAYGVPWREVVALNDLEEPYTLRVGQKLLLPKGATNNPDNMTVEQRAAAFDLNIDDIVTGSQPASTAAGTKSASLGTPIAAPGNFGGRFGWPVEGRLLSSFGSKGGGVVNDGINIGAKKGTPIRAAADGVVAYSGDEIEVFGGLVLINHGEGWVTAYGHADRLNVARGEKVKAGQVIGITGDSGYVNEPQVHFEIRKNRKPVNPIQHLPRRS